MHRSGNNNLDTDITEIKKQIPAKNDPIDPCERCLDYYKNLDAGSLPNHYIFNGQYMKEVFCQFIDFTECISKNRVTSEEAILYINVSKKWSEFLDLTKGFERKQIVHFLNNKEILDKAPLNEQINYYFYFSKFDVRERSVNPNSIKEIVLDRIFRKIELINGESANSYYSRVMNEKLYEYTQEGKVAIFDKEYTDISLKLLRDAYDAGLIELKAFGEE